MKMQNEKQEVHQLNWRGRNITIRFTRTKFGAKKAWHVDHLEIMTSDRSALPVTETGYRSAFIHHADTANWAGPIKYGNARNR